MVAGGDGVMFHQSSRPSCESCSEPLLLVLLLLLLTVLLPESSRRCRPKLPRRNGGVNLGVLRFSDMYEAGDSVSGLDGKGSWLRNSALCCEQGV